MLTDKLVIWELSDIHLGHRSTPTAHIIENLMRLLPDDEQMSHVDILILAGDIFDRMLYLSNTDIPLIYRWMYYLLQLCQKHDVCLRILEGTPSHDNKQSRLIIDMNEESKIGCDLQYFDDLTIEYMDKFGIHVLYIPDEYRPTPEQILTEVKRKLQEHNLTQVDFAVMHGQFEYQVPKNLRQTIPSHDSKTYLDMVKYLIYIGHVHQHSSYKRIIAAGSTDRLKHGEEEDKGMIKSTIYKNGKFSFNFIVNDGAMVYKTIDIRDKTVDEGWEIIKQVISTVKPGSYLRLHVNDDNEITHHIKHMKEKYFDYNWSIKVDKKDSKPITALPKPELSMSRLSSETIPSLLTERMQGQYDALVVTNVVGLLKEFIDEPKYDSGSE